jgi:hypothetical protein
MSIKIAIINAGIEEGDLSLEHQLYVTEGLCTVPDEFHEGWNWVKTNLFVASGRTNSIQNLVDRILKPIRFLRSQFGEDSTVTFFDSEPVELHQVTLKVNPFLYNHLLARVRLGSEYFENPENVAYDYFEARKFTFLSEPEIDDSSRSFPVGLVALAIQKYKDQEAQRAGAKFEHDARRLLRQTASLSRSAKLDSIYHLYLCTYKLEITEIVPTVFSEKAIGFQWRGENISFETEALLDAKRFAISEFVIDSPNAPQQNFFLGAAARQIGLIFQAYAIEMLFYCQESGDLANFESNPNEHWNSHMPILDISRTHESLLQRSN